MYFGRRLSVPDTEPLPYGIAELDPVLVRLRASRRGGTQFSGISAGHLFVLRRSRRGFDDAARWRCHDRLHDCVGWTLLLRLPVCIGPLHTRYRDGGLSVKSRLRCGRTTLALVGGAAAAACALGVQPIPSGLGEEPPVQGGGSDNGNCTTTNGGGVCPERGDAAACTNTSAWCGPAPAWVGCRFSACNPSGACTSCVCAAVEGGAAWNCLADAGTDFKPRCRETRNLTAMRPRTPSETRKSTIGLSWRPWRPGLPSSSSSPFSTLG